MRVGADAKQVHAGKLAEFLVATFDKSGFRQPTVRQKEWISVQHPLIIDPLVNVGCEFDDLRIFPEILPRSQRASHKPGRIACRYFAVPVALSIAYIDEVVEPTVLVFYRSDCIGTQCNPNAIASFIVRN